MIQCFEPTKHRAILITSTSFDYSSQKFVEGPDSVIADVIRLMLFEVINPMPWPPEPTTETETPPAKPFFARMLLVSTLAGGTIFGLCCILVPVQKAAGWAILAVLASAGIQGFSHCRSNSSRDNDGGSSPNPDACNLLDKF